MDWWCMAWPNSAPEIDFSGPEISCKITCLLVRSRNPRQISGPEIPIPNSGPEICRIHPPPFHTPHLPVNKIAFGDVCAFGGVFGGDYIWARTFYTNFLNKRVQYIPATSRDILGTKYVLLVVRREGRVCECASMSRYATKGGGMDRQKGNQKREKGNQKVIENEKKVTKKWPEKKVSGLPLLPTPFCGTLNVRSVVTISRKSCQVRAVATSAHLWSCVAEWPHIARYCDTIAAIPHVARYLFGEVSTPQKSCDTSPWHLVSHRHICAIHHFATYRAIIVRYPIKTSRN